jgi:hypothetical protein
MAYSSVCWPTLQANGWCAAKLVTGEHTSTVARHSFPVGRSGISWIEICHGGKGAGRSPSMRRRIFRNKPLGTATSANWNVTYRPCRATFAPILMSFSRSVVNDQCSTSCGRASVRRKLPILWASAWSCRRTSLSRKLWQDRRVQLIACLPSLICCSAVLL